MQQVPYRLSTTNPPPTGDVRPITPYADIHTPSMYTQYMCTEGVLYDGSALVPRAFRQGPSFMGRPSSRPEKHVDSLLDFPPGFVHMVAG